MFKEAINKFLFYSFFILIFFNVSLGSKLKSVTLITENILTGGTDNITWDGTECLHRPSKLLGYVFPPDCEECCINFYRSAKCDKTPFYLTARPTAETSYINNHGTFPGGHKEHDLLKEILSIGPCNPKCREMPKGKVDNNHEPQSFSVTLYEEPFSKGISEAVVINNNNCIVIPKALRRKVSSLKFDPICLELHQHWNCTGSFVQILKEAPTYVQNDLRRSHFDDRAAAISKCNYDCKRRSRILSHTTVKTTQIPSNTVTVFPETGFRGEYKHVNLSNGCVNLTEDWESIYTYGMCVKIYETEGCNQAGFHSLVQDKEWDLYSRNFETIRSIVSCQYASKYLEKAVPNETLSHTPSVVTIYSGINFTGDNKTLKVEDCISPLQIHFDKKIFSVKVESKTGCINLYLQRRCRGDYIQIKANSPSHDLRLMNVIYNNFNSIAGSIGPCYERCHPDNIEDDLKHKNVKVEIKSWSEAYSAGSHNIFHVNGCFEFPKFLKKKAHYVAFLSEWHEVCLELYENSDCTGLSIQIPKQTKTNPQHRLSDWKFEGMAQSISLCGFRCRNMSDYDFDYATYQMTTTTTTEVTRFGNGLISNDTGTETPSASIPPYSVTSVQPSPEGSSKISNSTENYITVTNASSMGSLGSEITLESHQKFMIYIAVPVIAMLIIIFLIVTIVIKRRSKAFLNQNEIKEFINGGYDQLYEISNASVIIDEEAILGLSECGIVYKGVLNAKEYDVNVAVKTLQPVISHTESAEYAKALLREVNTMIQVGKHSSVLELIGSYTEQLAKGELLIMTELCANGSLENFLKSHRNSFIINIDDEMEENSDKNKILRILSDDIGNEAEGVQHFNPDNFQLLKWSLEIAEGMEYLASKKVIHSDLSVRTILINSKFRTKISGFGISTRRYAFMQNVKKGQSPTAWRSMAIETLRDLEFSIQSDVWAYGVTLWGIFSLGDVPYPENEWGLTFLSELTSGLRLPQPKHASSPIYNLMLECWCKEPSQRKSFSLLTEEINTIIQMSSSEIKKITERHSNEMQSVMNTHSV